MPFRPLPCQLGKLVGRRRGVELGRADLAALALLVLPRLAAAEDVTECSPRRALGVRRRDWLLFGRLRAGDDAGGVTLGRLLGSAEDALEGVELFAECAYGGCALCGCLAIGLCAVGRRG
ncbi:hypothetical protein DMC30DRAFT_406864 [Rhodotorula diobovata]|uniref:Secreted protein n=1 Tax=Rhodotorula diobovata TaxID=5288 RepID=A0A5C5FL72_9BASI|nr:hypothetical protein DMC30DRAFT_406864 [Rhodotorula diobovata]